MSDERREKAWADWSRGGGPSPETIRRVGLMYMFRGAFDSGYDAASARVAQLEAALRTARETILAPDPDAEGVDFGPVLAEIDAVLGEP